MGYNMGFSGGGGYGGGYGGGVPRLENGPWPGLGGDPVAPPLEKGPWPGLGGDQLPIAPPLEKGPWEGLGGDPTVVGVPPSAGAPSAGGSVLGRIGGGIGVPGAPAPAPAPAPSSVLPLIGGGIGVPGAPGGAGAPPPSPGIGGAAPPAGLTDAQYAQFAALPDAARMQILNKLTYDRYNNPLMQRAVGAFGGLSSEGREPQAFKSWMQNTPGYGGFDPRTGRLTYIDQGKPVTTNFNALPKGLFGF